MKTIGVSELKTLMWSWQLNGPFDGSREDFYHAQNTAAVVSMMARDKQKIKRSDFLLWQEFQPPKRMTADEMRQVFQGIRSKSNGD